MQRCRTVDEGEQTRMRKVGRGGRGLGSVSVQEEIALTFRRDREQREVMRFVEGWAN